MSWRVVPVVARSARISPIAGANLKPCPEHGEATMMFAWPGSAIDQKVAVRRHRVEAGLGVDEPPVRRRDMLGDRRADQALVGGRHRAVDGVGIDGLVAVMMLGDLHAGADARAALRRDAVVHAVPALEEEHRQPAGCARRRVHRLEPAGHLAGRSQRQRRQQRLGPGAHGDDRCAGLDGAAIGDDGDAAVAGRDRVHGFAAAQLGVGGGRERHLGGERGLHLEESTVRLQYRHVVGWHLEGRKPPHQLGGGQNLMPQAVQAGGGERSRDQRAVGRADLEDAGDVKQPLPRGRFELAPQRIGVTHQRDVGGMLEIADPEDAGRAMRGAAVMPRREALEPQHPHAAAGEMKQRRAAGRSQPAHHHIEIRHRRLPAA